MRLKHYLTHCGTSASCYDQEMDNRTLTLVIPWSLYSQTRTKLAEGEDKLAASLTQAGFSEQSLKEKAKALQLIGLGNVHQYSLLHLFAIHRAPVGKVCLSSVHPLVNGQCITIDVGTYLLSGSVVECLPCQINHLGYNRSCPTINFFCFRQRPYSPPVQDHPDQL